MSEKHDDGKESHPKNTSDGNAPPVVVVEDADKEKNDSKDEHVPPSSADANAANKGNGKKKVKPSSTLKSTKSKSKTSTTSKSGNLEMPSNQCRRLTTAFNQLMELKDAGSAEGLVHKTIKEVEVELFKLREELELIKPTTELERQFKDSWIAKHVQRKESYLTALKKALIEEEQERNEQASLSSSTSSCDTELQAALEEAALLKLEEEQLLRRQELQRRQREEERREQQERDELQRRRQEAELRRDALSSRAALSRASSRHSQGGSQRRRGRSPAPPLLRVPQPTPEWIEQAGRRVEDSRDQAPGLMQQMLLLSQVKVPTFKGDALNYLWFKQSFEAQVEAATLDPVQRLHRLLQYLEGEPYRLVRGCQLAQNPEEGFRRAKGLLDDRYGHPVRQALAFKNKLLEWPTLKQNDDLTEFTIHLQQCDQVRLSGSTSLAELDDASTLLRLASKLPEKLQTSWQTRVVDIECKELRTAKFDDFLKFVHRHEIARNHPVYGKLRLGPKDAGANASNRIKAYVTEASEETDGHTQSEITLRTEATRDRPKVEQATDAFAPPCLFCNGEHGAARCKTTSLSREEKKAKLRGLCFACLKPGHSARFCKFRLKCDVCSGLHPTVLHEERKPEQPMGAPNEPSLPTKEPQETAVKENSLLTGAAPHYAMATVNVRLWTQDKTHSVLVKALLDAASSATFVTKDIAQKLKAPTQAVSLTLNTMSGETSHQTSTIQGLKVSDIDFNHVLPIGVTYVVDSLPDVNTPICAEDTVEKWAHLNDVRHCLPTDNEPIQMLVGQNVHGAHFPDDTRRGSDDEPFAVKTKLGWSIQGPMKPKAGGTGHKEIVNYTKASHEIQSQLKQLYYHEFANAYDFMTKGPSQEDKLWLRLVESSVQLTESGHFSISLPFRPGAEALLKDNKEQALRRLKSLERKFANDSSFRDDYCKFVQKMIDADHVERVPDDELQAAANYIPHHGVYHPQKKKIRVVFNCASKYNGLSLNDCLLSGPDLTNSIVGVLCRFRQFAVPFAADIEAMFYQVFVPPRQRDWLRFLWWEGGESDRNDAEVAVYRMKVHLFGATSSPSVANYALRKSADIPPVNPAIQRTILRNFYVDDCLKSADTSEEAIRVAKDLTEACSRGGFKLAKFVSSDVTLLRSLSKTQLAKELEELDLSEDKEDPLGSLQEKALGVVWNVKEDELGFRVQNKEDPKQRTTRRTVLSKISQVYDPLGMAAPVVIVARTFFRELTTVHNITEWDEELKTEEANRWRIWVERLACLRTTSIPRWMRLNSTEHINQYQLHAFCDASSEAYAAVIYLRRAPDVANEEAKVSFVFGKARVAPPKSVTIPRLELTAAKLAAELMYTMQNELEVEIESRVLWSDSQTILKYINNTTKRFHVFVSNRIETILNLTTTTEWRYVPTQLNPADDATRGMDAGALNESKWLRGPEFLRKPEAEWPATEDTEEVPDEDPEVKAEASSRKSVKEAVLQTLTDEVEREETLVEKLAKRYSTALQVRRALATWLRVKHKLKTGEMIQGAFQAVELKQAEQAGIKWLQEDCWYQEINALKQGQSVVDWLRKLNPKIQRNVLVMQSRTGIALPIVPDSHFARLLVQEGHDLEGHMGRQATAAAVKRSYWIIHLSKIVRFVTKRCPLCQRRKTSPGATQMADLPEMRLAPGPPFQTTGVDFFGPFSIRSNKTVQKAYGVIFTCAVSRAVHLELADSLDISSFINALRRFCARRGCVRTIICDNATNFTGACDAIQEEIDVILANCRNTEVISALRRRNVEWYFMPPSASHYGGFYERLIRCVRDVLMALIDSSGNRAPLTIDLMMTLLCECESILNDRPLTTVSNDPNDLEALTPNHLLLGRSNHGSPLPGNYGELKDALKYRWKLVQHLTSEFWRRWKKEYRTLLYRRSKWFKTIRRPFRINDVVLVKDPERAAREVGRLGRVVGVHPSTDGEVRVVDVQTAKGVITRPITKLCLLETASSHS